MVICKNTHPFRNLRSTLVLYSCHCLYPSLPVPRREQRQPRYHHLQARPFLDPSHDLSHDLSHDRHVTVTCRADIQRRKLARQTSAVNPGPCRRSRMPYYPQYPAVPSLGHVWTRENGAGLAGEVDAADSGGSVGGSEVMNMIIIGT